MSSYPMWYIPLRFLPVSARNELADILDTHGDISMEIFGQDLDRLHQHHLGLETSKLNAFRYQMGRRPTLLLLEHLEKFNVTVGHIQYVLDNMRAATRGIFQKYTREILGMYRHHEATSMRTSNSSQSQHNCQCNDCTRANVYMDPRLHTTGVTPGAPLQSSLRDSHMRMYPNIAHPQPRERREHQSRFNEHGDWSPPHCDEPHCDMCDTLRTQQDAEETLVLSASSIEQTARVRRNHQITHETNSLSPRTGHVSIDGRRNIEEDELRNDISYSENPSNSVNLRGTPDGVSQAEECPSWNCKHDCAFTHGATGGHELNCTCRCTCKKDNMHTKLKRWSDSKFSTGKSDTSTLSSSDSNISYHSQYSRKEENTGVNILISYTDDVRTDAADLAGELKERMGHNVSTDIRQITFVNARKHCLIEERDIYTWLSNKYQHADCVIICTSKGYNECLNMKNSACPSPLYLNAKYIFDLISNDQQKIKKTVVEVCFQENLDESCQYISFDKRFCIPKQMDYLENYLRNLLN